MNRYVLPGSSVVLVMSSATCVSGTLADATSGGALSAGATGSALGGAAGVGSSGGVSDADADAAGFGAFFLALLALVALCASASGATANVSSATAAKKECRCRPIERGIEDLWSARVQGGELVARAMLHYSSVLGGSALPDHPSDSPRPHRQTIGRSRREFRVSKRNHCHRKSGASRDGPQAPRGRRRDPGARAPGPRVRSEPVHLAPAGAELLELPRPGGVRRLQPRPSRSRPVASFRSASLSRGGGLCA